MTMHTPADTLPTLADFEAARERIDDIVERTAMVASAAHTSGASWARCSRTRSAG